MKRKTIIRAFIYIIFPGLLIIYFVAGHAFVKFYVGGKKELLTTAKKINVLCNKSGTCPTRLAGWESNNYDSETVLRKGNMLCYVTSITNSKDGNVHKKYQSFRLVYTFFQPDSWYEAQGGVGKVVTSGWESR